MANRMRSALKERQWRAHVSGWRLSGVSIRQYCLRHHLSEPSFYAWRRELARRDEMAGVPVSQVRRTQPASVSWMPVTVTPSDAPASAAPVVEVQLPGGALLRVPAGVQSETLLCIVTALQQAAGPALQQAAGPALQPATSPALPPASSAGEARR